MPNKKRHPNMVEVPGAAKKDLSLDSPPSDHLAALAGAAERYNSDLTRVVGRDASDKLLFVAVHAKGEYAPKLLRFLDRLARREDKA